MESYFSAIQPHLQDRVDFAIISNNQSSSSKTLVSIGIDNFIYIRDLSSNEEQRIQLNENSSYQCIAKSTAYKKCILGNQNGSVDEFNLQNQQTKEIYKSQFKINSLTNSPNNRFLAIATQQSKCILIDMQTLRSSKCRPGHERGVANASFSSDEKYLASIGKDRSLLIYNIENFDQPLEVYQYKICKSDQVDPSTFSGCFNKLLPIFYCPGSSSLQQIELLNNKWQYRVLPFIKHERGIINLVKTLKVYLLITCTQFDLLIWNSRSDQKIIVVQNFTLYKAIQFNDKFWGCKNDGKFYFYQKQLNERLFEGNQRKENQKMQIQLQIKPLEANNNGVINFDDSQQQESQEDGDIKQIQEQIMKYQHKKSKADKIVTQYPQDQVVNCTKSSKTQNSRYIFSSQDGYLIQTGQSQFQIRIEFQSQDEKKNQLLFLNKQILFADFNSSFVAYANQSSFGVKFLDKFADFEPWQKAWWDINCIACSCNWIAVANEQQIKIFDITGNQIKVICFDRLIIAMTAYQNILSVVYHESIPIEGAQCLAMQIFVINNQRYETIKLTTCHVPVKPKAKLDFFRFTKEGMLLSKDTAGFIKIYNLQNNLWTSVFIESIENTRRIWLLGMQNYEIVYWKTSQINPNPQVFPRLPVKRSRLGINVSAEDTEEMKEYPFLIFERFVLDHEKCRSRLWFHLKLARSQKHTGFQQVSTILSEKQLMKRHNQLDHKFYKVISFYIKSNMLPKAVLAVKSFIRTMEAIKQLIDIFDDCKRRNQAIQIQVYYEQRVKQLQYETIQALQLQNLKIQAQKCIKPKGQYNPFNKKKNDISQIPSLNTSQMSQASNFDNLSQRSTIKESKQNGMKMANKNFPMSTPQKQQISNPFMKKKSTQDDMNLKSKQIQEQIQKFGVKRKAEVNKRQSKN